jgi:hypothetical protein
MRYLPQMETTADFTLVVDDQDIGTLPTDLQTPINLRIIIPNQYSKVLQPWDFEDFDVQYPQPELFDSNTPILWYYFDDTVKVFPTPDQAFTVRLRYVKTPTELSGDSDVPEIPSEFQELLVLGAFRRALEFNDNYDQAVVIQAQMNEQIDSITKRYGLKTATTQISGVNRRRTNLPWKVGGSTRWGV